MDLEYAYDESVHGTCMKQIRNQYHHTTCGRPAKGWIGGPDRKQLPACGVHIAQARRHAEQKVRRAAEREQMLVLATRVQEVKGALLAALQARGVYPGDLQVRGGTGTLRVTLDVTDLEQLLKEASDAEA